MFHAISLANVVQGTDEWRAARKAGIGGSDAAASIGLDDYKSPFELWQDKLNLVPDFTGNWHTKRGSALEPVLRDHYAEKFGSVVRVPEHILQHPHHKFMLASLDGFTDEGRIQEFKTSMTAKGWGEEGTDEIPQKYLVQVQHNLIVTGAQIADVSVSIAGGEPRYYLVEADKELQDMIIEGEAKFWEKVESKIEPDASSLADYKRKFSIREGVGVAWSPEIASVVAELHSVKMMEKEIGERIDAYKEVIQKYLLEHGAEILLDSSGGVMVTWKAGKPRVTIDSKALQAAHPDIYAQFSKTGAASRTFLIK